MKILQVHNYYQQRGGEATVVALEKKLLEDQGHELIFWSKDNAVIDTWPVTDKLKLMQSTTHSKKSAVEFDKIVEQEQPDICHVHNFFPLISPSIYAVCQRHQIPVVQTLHNYRLICTNGVFFRNGTVCEDCLGQSAYGAVRKKCYRNSALQTWTVARMIEKNKRNRVWEQEVDAYICLSEFARNKFIEHGLPAEKLVVKPNFIEEIEITDKPDKIEEIYFVFAGRLTTEKGIELLAEIGRCSPYPIYVFGEGSERHQLEGIDQIFMLGNQPRKALFQKLKGAKALLFPSIWYEGMPMTILEAFSLGTPVVSHELGVMSTLIRSGENGLFAKANAQDWLNRMKELATDRQVADKLSLGAQNDYENNYRKLANYQQLMRIYENVLAAK